MRHDLLVDAFVVDQVAHRFADFLVGEFGLLHAHRHVVHGAALQRLHLQLGRALDGLDVWRGHAVDQVEVTALEHQP
ncbi:hypothetical protein D3C79_833070 [compost metagenome]